MAKLVIAAVLALALCALVSTQRPGAGDDKLVVVGGRQGRMVTIAGKTVFVPNGVRYSRPGKPQKTFKCTWVTGKGAGLKSLSIVSPQMSGQQCVDTCYRKSLRKRNKIDSVVEFQDESRKGCWCISKIHDVTAKLVEFKTCYFDPKKAAEAAAAAAIVAGGDASANACPGTGLVPKLKGCYNANNRGRYFYNQRLTIDWSQDGHPVYGKNFVCACADAAQKAGIKMFGTHYWGECWELQEEDLGGESADGCRLADGLYQTKSCDDKSKACLGVTGYGVHTY